MAQNGGFGGQNRGRGGAILTPNELILTFQGSYVCANFGENRSRNATVRVLADGQTDRHTHTHTHTQTQTDFYRRSGRNGLDLGNLRRHYLENEYR